MRKGGNLIFLVVVLALVLILPHKLQAQTVPNNLTVNLNNDPPLFIQNISNQTWPRTTNLTNAFDLDDYFTDNSSLTFTASTVANITISIDSDGIVSFYPDYSFEGIRYVVFTATDPYFESTISNNITLNVTNDTEPPQWSNVAKDIADASIFQNTIVVFSADWTDNYALSSYYFSINQGSGFVDQSPVSFTGLSNSSTFTTTITAAGGTTVSWKFTALDTTGNSNTTTTQSFTVVSFDVPPPAGGGTGTGGTGSGGSSGSSSGGSSGGGGGFSGAAIQGATIPSYFTIEPEQFNIELKQGQSTAISAKITNIGSENLSFDTIATGLDEFSPIYNKNNFTLAPGEFDTIVIQITAPDLMSPDVYNAELYVDTPPENKSAPISITVKQANISFEILVDVQDDYETSLIGENVVANITLTNTLDVASRDLEMYYAILDFRGNIINSVTQTYPFSEREITFEKSIDIPAGTPEGKYIFFARAVNGADIALDGDAFDAVGVLFSPEFMTVASFIRTNLIIILIILLAILAAFLMVRHLRNKEKLRLLNLYLMVTQMKKLLAEENYEDAIDLYVRIKAAYGQPVSKTALENMNQLKEEMKALVDKLELRLRVVHEAAKAEAKEKEDKKKAKEEKSDEKKEGEDKPEEETEAKPEEKLTTEGEKTTLDNKPTEETKLEAAKKVEDDLKEEIKEDTKPEAKPEEEKSEQKEETEAKPEETPDIKEKTLANPQTEVKETTMTKEAKSVPEVKTKIPETKEAKLDDKKPLKPKEEPKIVKKEKPKKSKEVVKKKVTKKKVKNAKK